jgi:hypothetical protein
VQTRTRRIVAGAGIALALMLPAAGCDRTAVEKAIRKSVQNQAAGHDGWVPVPPDIRKQFADDGDKLDPRCRIKFGDTTVIRCPDGKKRIS